MNVEVLVCGSKVMPYLRIERKDIIKNYKFGFFLKLFFEIYREYSDTEEYQLYLSKWEYILSLLRKSIKSDYKQYNKLIIQEIYQYEFPFKLNFAEKYTFFFNIDNILKKVDFSDYKIFDVEELKNNAVTKKIDIIDDKVKSDPIILINFNKINPTNVVIDGNTRLSYHIDKGYSTIKAITYEANNRDDFILSFDWAFFCFFSEMTGLLKLRNSDKFLPELKKSFIYSENFISEVNQNIKTKDKLNTSIKLS